MVATVFPIDKIIGRVYPIFGAILVFSAIGVFAAMVIFQYPLVEGWGDWATTSFDYAAYFKAGHFIPIFFVTVACGILSGFHSSQTALVARTIKSEKDGRMTFYNMMVVEGFIAMVWAAGTMALIQFTAANGGITMQLSDKGVWQYMIQKGGELVAISPTSVVGVLCRKALGPVGGAIALIGIIILPVTSGDTALRALRLTIADTFHIKQDNNPRRLSLALPIFIIVGGILVWAKVDPKGFNVLWRYFAWSNQTMALFPLAAASIYLIIHNKVKWAWMTLIPGVFYTYICACYILNAKLGFGQSWGVAYIGGAVVAAVYAVLILWRGKKGGTTPADPA